MVGDAVQRDRRSPLGRVAVPLPKVTVATRTMSYTEGRVAHRGDRLTIDAPYHPDFVTAIKDLGGKWSPDLKVWHCALTSEHAVRAVLRDVYGVDRGGAIVAVVNLLLTRTSDDPQPADLWIAGKPVTSKGRLAADVTRRPTGAGGPYALVLADVAASLAERAIASPPDGWLVSLLEQDAPIPAAVRDLVAPVWARALPLAWDDKAALTRLLLDWLTANKPDYGPRDYVDDVIAELTARLQEVMT